ncbi:class I SAM-dependent methyltransferase [Paenibacillus rigui]|uniref:class I SAM-dependent methyltransferase n=1 Tax=Paenibacillus rigui TaxID=554312 RepID=UPI001FECF80F|nr:class I SAM-dependent methyltransferase [Paenibacillus rigui]
MKTIMELMSAFESKSEVNVLDLGCGVGRNSIPVAQQILKKEGKVVCIDLLESAISKLEEYSKQYHMMSKIEGVLSDIAGYRMAPKGNQGPRRQLHHHWYWD